MLMTVVPLAFSILEGVNNDTGVGSWLVLMMVMLWLDLCVI